jgi:DNA-binding winged helix-turn-helix (wHTH) protein
MQPNVPDLPTPPEVIKFGAFEVHTGTGELRKHGIRLNLGDQPFRILTALLQRPGELVAREELREIVWPGESFGDFEQRLNRAVGRLREVLGDSAANPRFVETLTGRGYRYIGPIQSAPSTAVSAVTPAWNRRAIFLVVAAFALIALIAGGVWLFLPPKAPDLRWRKLTTDNYDKMAPALSDGTRIYFLAAYSGEQFIAQVSPDGGHPTRLPITLPGPYCALQDLSRDGQELLLTAATTIDRRTREMPLWTLRVADGTARRLGGINATSAAYSPNAPFIAYSVEGAVWVANQNGTQPRKIHGAAG